MKNKKSRKIEKKDCVDQQNQQEQSCCRVVSYCDCCGCYDEVYCC
jgi:hypothetical protein